MLSDKVNSAAKDADSWAVGVTLIIFAIAHHNHVKKEAGDQDRNCSHRQDRVLVMKSREGEGWAQKFASRDSTIKVIMSIGCLLKNSRHTRLPGALEHCASLFHSKDFFLSLSVFLTH